MNRAVPSPTDITMSLVNFAKQLLLWRTHHGRAPKSGLPLPPLQYRMGGEHFKRDEDFLRGANADVQKLIKWCGLNSDSAVLDWGCGAGRLAIGIAETFGRAKRYHGVDIQENLVRWAQRHLGAQPGFLFTLADVANARYNPEGGREGMIPAETGAYDIVYAYSVFSHMRAQDVRTYMSEIVRVLRPGGTAWFSAFVEENVPDEVENPQGYGPMVWRGPLHCVRFDHTFFTGMMADAGLTVVHFQHGRETDGQSMFVVRN